MAMNGVYTENNLEYSNVFITVCEWASNPMTTRSAASKVTLFHSLLYKIICKFLCGILELEEVRLWLFTRSDESEEVSSGIPRACWLQQHVLRLHLFK